MPEILNCLRNLGQQMDSEIAAATGIPLADVRRRLLELSTKGGIMTCRATRFIDGQKIEGMLCRAIGPASSLNPVRAAKPKKNCRG
ncbi:transcriptional regulator [Thiocystis minor]|nr:transcriptional regulator [Thiocystis minor]